MSNPILATPPLPNLTAAATAYDAALKKALDSYLFDMARRVNGALQEDGSEAMMGSLNMGGFDITNIGNIVVSGTVAAVNIGAVNIAATSTMTLAGDPVRTEFHGHLYGLTIQNNGSDAVNDIDISVGDCATDSVTALPMVLASGLTKRLDANWAVGTNHGGLDTGAVADNTYHVWLIKRPDTGVVDVLFSLSATAPTMPASYTLKRRIASIIRFGATILAFQQLGDTFNLSTPIVNRSSTAALASSLVATSVPAGINVFPLLQGTLNTAAASSATVSMGNGAGGGTVISVQAEAASSTNTVLFPPFFFTNTSRQIYYSVVIGAGTLTGCTLTTVGWIDPRGRS